MYARRDIDTPIGPYTLAASAEGLTHVAQRGAASLPPGAEAPDAKPHLDAAERALAEYFAGGRRDFRDLPLAPVGTAFQRRVWNALLAIPFGETRSYSEVALQIGREGAARAVGMANHHNPLAIVVPCHRVVGADGALTGYAGGLDRKRWLLAHESTRA